MEKWFVAALFFTVSSRLNQEMVDHNSYGGY
jgi:hypothetical protein